MIPCALTIAGSDSGGGAGIQADLKTFQELEVFGTSALTAVTSQNTTGVSFVEPLSLESIRTQIEAVLSDFPIRAMKTGMLFSSEIIREVASILREQARIPLVVDPVMIAKGGAELLRADAVQAMRNELLPLAFIVTPNIPEAETLADMAIHSPDDMIRAARRIQACGAQNVLVKGGHAESDEGLVQDIFVEKNRVFALRSPRIQTKNTHGTGCTSSAALTAFLAKGLAASDAVLAAKGYIQAAIEDELKIGSGHGPTNHWAHRTLGLYREDIAREEL